MNDTLLDNDIPEKFKDPESGEIRMDTLLHSYKALEKKLSSKPGAPKSAEDYCIKCDHGLFEVDPAINARLHAKGFNDEQAQEVYDLAAERLVPMVNEIMADAQADREVEKLINHFGGVDAWKEVSHQLLAFGAQNLPPEVLNNLSSSYEGVLALHRMMKSDEPSLQREAEPAHGGGNEDDLKSMMRDPRYWRERDPAFVGKVTQGFKDLYGQH